MQGQVHIEQPVGGIAVLIMDNPPVNAISAGVREGLRAALVQLSACRDVQALVLLCAGTTFCAGADIREFEGPPREAEYRALFAAVEQLSLPVIAALHGTALGGGLELALACHYRVAVANARMGLPEVTLGIIPGAGGTQRLPRLVGIEQALEMIVSAKPVEAQRARELGLIDQIIAGELREGAVDFAQRLLREGRGARRTCDRAPAPATGGAEVMARAAARARELYPNRTAALRAIEAVAAAATMPFEQGLDNEARIANETKATLESKALIHVFFAERETRRVPELGEVAALAIREAAVVGAGTMGSGIAVAFANAGIPVRLLDSGAEALERGRRTIEGLYEGMVKRGRLQPAEKASRLALIRATLDYAQIAGADVIVEAVFEDMALKQGIFRELDRAAKPAAVLASNTSTLDIEQLGAVTRRPQNVIGMHFFSPANVMPLLEVVRTRQTSPQIIRTVLELARTLRKTPVLARVCYGFIGNRMMEPYAREAERLVLEGETPRRIDTVLEQFGMAMGILAVFDMAGVDVGVKVHQANAERYPPDPTYYQASAALYQQGRLGQKSGRGYYRYEAGNRTRHDDPEALAILQARAHELGVRPVLHDESEILERCLFPLMNEGFRVLEEGIALRAGDIDVVWTAGYGFPRYRGGPMFHADVIGLRALLAGMCKYRDRFGPMHWQPAPLLERLVSEGMTLAQWERHTGSARAP
jgi:3-hydroxyacyl-CoA dehydrogenase